VTPPPNDPSIDGDLALYRRIPTIHVVPDENRGCVRVSSAAFSGEEMSIVLDDTLLASGRNPEGLVDGFADVFLAILRPALARANGQGVVRSPQAIEPAHGDVIGPKSKAVRRLFACEATWSVPPPNAC
jgi:hypothetical protein